MTASTVPAVIDWALANMPTTVGADTWLVSDGWPTAETSRLVIVGGLAAPVSQISQLAFLGDSGRFEDYAVTIEWRASTGDTNQKTVRDAVYAAKGAFEDVLRADMTLGGIIPHIAELVADQLEQTSEEAAPSGRFAILTSQLRIRDAY